jgi:SAM-dependent methyltransferase
VRSPGPAPDVWAPTLGRSVRLFKDFRVEQSDPARFYRALAADSVGQVGSFLPGDGLRDETLLDVGGGPGYFADAFEAAGATYLMVEADAGELAGMGPQGRGTVIASGMALPFADGSVDVCYSSNVLEHVADPWLMADEMLRVTRPGGLVFLSYTVWFGPWGGHETSPWHLLGGMRARRRYRQRHGHEPKNKYGESLFAVTVAAGLSWARRTGESGRAEVVACLPRYHPRWAWWVLRVPLLRELVTWNLALVLRRR